ncbi:MAG TPA: SRPBCC family protein [Caulobacteraceae bacterium]|nr:SRPBCC family protein [Caulobacteraceae bacterium]
MRGLGVAAAVLGLALAGAARADVVETTASGFQVKETAEIAAPAAKVWAALGDFGAWWSSEHSWSHDAKNFQLELKPGGCLCETLPGGGGVRHLSVIFVAPGKTAILDGALGPLIFSGSAGRLVWSLAEKDGHTTLTQTYYVGGYYPGGFDKIAPAVDGVLTEQIARLKRLVETGKPSA